MKYLFLFIWAILVTVVGVLVLYPLEVVGTLFWDFNFNWRVGIFASQRVLLDDAEFYPLFRKYDRFMGVGHANAEKTYPTYLHYLWGR